MHLLTTVLTLLCLGACGPMTESRDAGVYRAGWGQDRKVARDVEAILQGIEQSRAENGRLQRDPAMARPAP